MARPSLSPSCQTALGRALDGLLVAAATLTLVTLALGRIEIDLPAVRLHVNSAWRPTIFLAIVGAVWWRARRTQIRPHVLARLGFAALLAAWVLTCLNFGVHACGGLDSSGYVGASALLASGRLEEDQPIARLLPFPEAPYAAAPLGFVVGRDGHSRVPRFPLGLPIVMTLFRALGPEGPFWVPLFMAVGTLVLVYRLGRSDDDSDCVSGLFAAAVVAVSPTFFNGAIQPMSDVPATFWILAAVSLSLARSCRPIGAGLAAGMAVLTRPVLLPASLAIAGLLIWRCRRHPLPLSRQDAQPAISTPGSAAAPRASRASLVAGVSVLGVFLLMQAGLNVFLYGGVASSGYGSLTDLLQPARILRNIAVYMHWTTYTHTVAFWIAWGAGLVVLRGRRWPARFSLVAAAAAAPYLLYLTFDDWETTRFVLPALALALIVGARGVDVVLARYVRAWRPVLLLSIALVCAAGSHRFLSARNVFDLWRGESKYPRVGQWVREQTPPGAVVVSALHSGSIRYYAGRDTVRWDVIPERMLAPSVGNLTSHGHAVYLALDVPSEADPFAARFRDDLSHVSMIPLARVDAVLLYELQCRAPSTGCRVAK